MAGKNGKKPSVTRATLCDEIMTAIPDISQRDASKMVDNILRAMRDTLSKGEEIKISGFGKFVLHEKSARKGRNPQTGETITISARRVLKFRPSDVLREQLNDNLFEDLGG